MSAAEALRAAHLSGVRLTVEGENLLLEASTQPSDAVVDALWRHKAAIISLLRPTEVRWNADDWQAYCDKRAGTAESSGGLSRAKAEALAFACCVVEWLNRHPAPSSPGRCAWCGMPESTGAVVLPFGTEPGAHAWLHAECWPVWYQNRHKQAAAALAAIGFSWGGGTRDDG